MYRGVRNNRAVLQEYPVVPRLIHSVSRSEQVPEPDVTDLVPSTECIVINANDHYTIPFEVGVVGQPLCVTFQEIPLQSCLEGFRFRCFGEEEDHSK